MDMLPFAPPHAAHAIKAPEPVKPPNRLWIAMGTAALAEHMVYEARTAFKDLPILSVHADEVNFMLAGCSAMLREVYSQMEAARKEMAGEGP